MGVCQQCAVWIDGVRVEACRTPVRAGLDVRTRR
jgi:predicted molibdopterin-dependent oxidoreductase YjgC